MLQIVILNKMSTPVEYTLLSKLPVTLAQSVMCICVHGFRNSKDKNVSFISVRRPPLLLSRILASRVVRLWNFSCKKNIFFISWYLVEQKLILKETKVEHQFLGGIISGCNSSHGNYINPLNQVHFNKVWKIKKISIKFC